MAQAYLDLNELYGISDSIVTELMKQLKWQTEQKEALEKDHTAICQHVAIVEGRNEDFTFALEEKENEFQRMESWYIGRQAHFDQDTRFMETKIKELERGNGDGDYAENRACELENRLEQQERQIKTQGGQIKEQEARAADAKKQHAADVQKLNERVKELEAQATDYNTLVAEKIKTMATEIDGYNKEAEAVGERAAVDVLEMEALEKRAEKQENRADAAEKRFAAAMQKIEELEGKPSQQSAGTRTDEDALGAKAKIQGLEVSHAQLQQKLVEQELEMKTLEGRLSSIDMVTVRADAAEAKINEIEKSKVDLEGRLERAEQRGKEEVERMSTEWEANMAKADEEKDMAFRSRDAAHRDLALMEGKHHEAVTMIKAAAATEIARMRSEARTYEINVKKEKQELQNEIGVLRAQVQPGNQMLQIEQARADDYQARLDQAIQANTGLSQQIQQLQEQVATLRPQPPIPGRVTFRQKLEEEIKAHGESKRVLAECKKELVQFKGMVDAQVKNKCGDYLRYIKKLEEDIKVLKKERDSSRANNQAHRDIAQDHRQRNYDLEQTLKSLKLEIGNMCDEKAKLQHVNDELVAHKAELEVGVTVLKSEKKKLGEDKKKLIEAALKWQGLIKDAKQGAEKRSYDGEGGGNDEVTRMKKQQKKRESDD